MTQTQRPLPTGFVRLLTRAARQSWSAMARGGAVLVRGFAGRPARGRAAVIGVGIGQGLRFDPGPSNPEYASGANELPVQQALADHVRPGATFYDIGANVGFFTVLGARLVGPAGWVYSFEPVPENAAFVRRNLAANGLTNVEVIERAVSRASGKGEFVLARYSGGGALSTASRPPDAMGTLGIDVVAIDDLLARSALRAPDVVKVDVEGSELDVFVGMRATLERHQPVIVYEIDDGAAAPFEAKRAACEGFLRTAGYDVVPLDKSYPTASWLVGNYLAIPAARSR
jgi:FkbM family methyltransferase